MRNRGDVSDSADLESKHTKGPDSALAAYAWSLYIDIHFPEAEIHSLLRSCLTGCLCSIRSGFLSAAESESASRGPCNRISSDIGNRDDRIVEGRLDVDVSLYYGLLCLFLYVSHFSPAHYFFLLATVFFLPFLVLALVFVLCPLTGRPFLCLSPL